MKLYPLVPNVRASDNDKRAQTKSILPEKSFLKESVAILE